MCCRRVGRETVGRHVELGHMGKGFYFRKLQADPSAGAWKYSLFIYPSVVTSWTGAWNYSLFIYPSVVTSWTGAWNYSLFIYSLTRYVLDRSMDI
jgi:hypothetical protein